jgi:hypothetical protein
VQLRPSLWWAKISSAYIRLSRTATTTTTAVHNHRQQSFLENYERTIVAASVNQAVARILAAS